MNDHGLEQLVHWTKHWIWYSFLSLVSFRISTPGQTQWSWYRSWNFESYHFPYKETPEKGVSILERWVWNYKEGCTWICKGKIFQWSFGYSLRTRVLRPDYIFFFQNSADKYIPSKMSRSVSSVPWIIPEIWRKIRRKKKETHSKAKKTGSSTLRSKFETLRREIKAETTWFLC